MIKKIKQAIVAILLVGLSFFYTEKTIDILKQNDPIMKKIVHNQSKYNKEPRNATIVLDSIIPGIAGSKVDLDESFKKMKKYGNYNESLLVFEEVKPVVSIEEEYSKYVISGNAENMNVAILFVVERDDNINDILSVLETEGVNGTFFVDGLWLENNQNLVVNMSELDMEIEILNYNYSYQKKYFKSALNISKTLTNKDNKYCYAEYDKKEVLELCGSLNMQTVIPGIVTSNNPFSDVKNSLVNGSIISFKVNDTTKKQLQTIISYIKQKGYNIVILDKLLNE